MSANQENERDQQQSTEDQSTETLSLKAWRKTKNPNRKRHGARNQNRHKAFVKWLEDTFPEAFRLAKIDSEDGIAPIQQVQQHVLDVAGGKGETAARLCMCHNVRVVMVDPRKGNIADCYERDVVPKLPKKWQERIKDRVVENEDFITKIVGERFRQLVTTFTNEDVAASSDLQECVQNATLLLGLHADGATEAIVDAALEYGKPFVVVPCCVFPNFFQQRQVRNEDGNMVPVRSHEQFCQYLQAKHSEFQLSVLPFEGRNVAIHWQGR